MKVTTRLRIACSNPSLPNCVSLPSWSEFTRTIVRWRSHLRRAIHPTMVLPIIRTSRPPLLSFLVTTPLAPLTEPAPSQRRRARLRLEEPLLLLNSSSTRSENVNERLPTRVCTPSPTPRGKRRRCITAARFTTSVAFLTTTSTTEDPIRILTVRDVAAMTVALRRGMDRRAASRARIVRFPALLAPKLPPFPTIPTRRSTPATTIAMAVTRRLSERTTRICKRSTASGARCSARALEERSGSSSGRRTTRCSL